MPDHDDLLDDVDALDAADDDLLTRLRPLPPRTWRDRLDDLLADPPPWGRLGAAVAVAAIVVVVAVRALAPPATPAESELPLAQPAEAGVVGAASEGGAEPAGPGAPGTIGADGTPPIGAGGATGSGPGTGVAAAPGAATEVVVHVVGAVAAPGVQRLPAGARVVDAVTAAGGAAADADLTRVNLAAVLVDGQQVVILRPGELPPPGVGPVTGGGAGAVDPASGETLVNLNTASPTELEELPGVGPATAEAIVSHRDQQGPFASVDDLLDVRGIGEAKLEQLRAHATV